MKKVTNYSLSLSTNTTILRLCSVGVLAVLLISTFVLQVQYGPSAARQVKATSTWQIVNTPARGLFYDRHGERLVTNSAAYQLWVSSEEVKMEVAEQLGGDQWVSVADRYRWTDLLSNNQRLDLLANLSEQTAQLIELVEVDLRDYAYPEALSHVLGYTAPVSSDEIDQGYRYDARIGRYGLESVWENDLSGLASSSYANNYQLLDTLQLNGNSVALTIDAQWQSRLYEVLADESVRNGAIGAAGIIINSNTGEIVSMISYPGFDANQFERGIDQNSYQNLLTSIKEPLQNKVVGLQSPPGSTFKLFGAYSLLTNSIIDPGEKLLSNRCMRLGANAQFCEIDNHYLGYVNMESAIYRSSNIYFCKAMQRLDHDLGIDVFAEDARSFGFGQSTGSPFGGEVSGNVPDTSYKLREFEDNWYDGDTCNMAIGQGLLSVTPIQLAYAYATLVNGGSLYRPWVVSEVRDPQGFQAQSFDPELVRKVDIPENVESVLASATKETVSSYQGSAHRLSSLSQELNLRAKTGSAEAAEYIKGQKVSGVHGWVMVAFDYSGEQYVLVVMQRFGGRSYQVLPTVERFLQIL